MPTIRRGAPLVVLVLLATAAPVARAQAPTSVVPTVHGAAHTTRRLTLDEALQLAEGGSEQVAAAQAGVRRAEGQVDLVRSGLYPQLGGSVAFTRTLQTQFDGIFDTDAAAAPCAGLTVNPAAPIDRRLAELERFLQCPPANPFGGGGDNGNDLPFGQLNTYTANLQFSQRVYDGGALRAQERQAMAGREAAAFGVTTTRAQLDLDVATAFYDAALTDRLVSITDATLSQAGETLRQVELQFKVGQIAEFEVLRARVTRDNQRASLIRTRVQRDLAYLRLKQLLNLPADQPLEVEANLAEPTGVLASRWTAPLAEAEAAFRLVPRTAVQQTEATVQTEEAAVALTHSQFRPQVTVTSAFTAYAYDPLPRFKQRDWTVTASVSLPLLDGGRRKASRAIAEATLEERRQQLQQVREVADLDQRTARATWEAARAAWEASAGTVEQAQRAYEIADVRYREGLSTQLELNDARLALQVAETERAQAARDLQVARSRLVLLPDLPLLAAGQPAAGAGSGGAASTPPQNARGSAQQGAPAGATTGAGAGGAGTQTGVRQ